ncbi:hypothetical protein PUN28_019278 [Cardiocondyla obscurior]|uniref:Uncharacterized protein n=1 Tax=Cardiocondyla obscurior TaxID=286306 RepID=A0AAW2EF22_9HYME
MFGSRYCLLERTSDDGTESTRLNITLAYFFYGYSSFSLSLSLFLSFSLCSCFIISSEKYTLQICIGRVIIQISDMIVNFIRINKLRDKMLRAKTGASLINDGHSIALYLFTDHREDNASSRCNLIVRLYITLWLFTGHVISFDGIAHH